MFRGVGIAGGWRRIIKSYVCVSCDKSDEGECVGRISRFALGKMRTGEGG